MNRKYPGYLIAVEGIDGSGKSTLVRALENSLTKNKRKILVTKEPGGTPFGEQLRSLLQYRSMPITPRAEYLLFAADRAQHFATKVIPALLAGQLVITDRCSDSSTVYQGYGRGLDVAMIQAINQWAMQGYAPDVTVYLRLDPAIAAQRLRTRAEKVTVFEQERQCFMEALVAGFDTLYHDRDDVVLLDATQSTEELVQKVRTAIEERYV